MRHDSSLSSKKAPPPGDGRKLNAAATHAALRSAGRKMFGELGYEATSLGALCLEAGVTTGALYHHFGDKKGLFAAVAEDLDAGLVLHAGKARERALAQGVQGWDAFLAAMDAFLDAGLDPHGLRIGLTDAPAVLGAQAWLEIRERHGLGAMVQTVQGLQAQGLMHSGDARRRARIVLGLMYGAIEALAHDAKTDPNALPDIRQMVHAMLAGMRP